MPRQKKAVAEAPADPLRPMPVEDLLKEHFAIEDWIKSEEKKFAEFLQPYKDRDEFLRGQMQQKLNELGPEGERRSIRTDYGTIYNSTVTTPRIIDREKYLDLVLEHYDTFGNGMLQLRAPNKESVETYIKDNNGQLPQGVEISSVLHLNIRRS